MRPYTLKKSLGQHFLHDQNMAQKIVKSLSVQAGDKVLEVGPGGGALTQWLLKEKDIELKAIEVDEEKVVYLLNQYPELKGKLLHQDFLKSEIPFEDPFHVIGNFPYVISSQILFKMIDWREQVKSMVGMFQKEVAKRVVSPPGNKEYGILSVLIAAFFKTDYLFEVHKNCFTPPPKVQSAVIKLTPLEKPYEIENIPLFIKIVKAAFQQRRKILRNPLKSYFCKETLEEPIFNKRAEELDVTAFIELSTKASWKKRKY